MDPTVVILMSTYNGEKYLKEQLDSVLSQNTPNLFIYIRDDGSVDSTLNILFEYQQKNSNISYYEGSNVGSAESFMSLILRAPQADYYAFCDQDDVWLADKIETAINKINISQIPTLYFSQTTLVNEILASLHTPLITPTCTFEEALSVNYATGCTMVFNHCLMKLLQRYKPSYISMHDYWIYRVCLCVGGKIIFDPQSHILYRQHSNNVIGLRRNRRLMLKRRCTRILNKERERSKTFKEILNGYTDFIKPEYVETLRLVANYRDSQRMKKELLLKCKQWKTSFSLRLSILLEVY